MPLFTYQCTPCNNTLDVLVSKSDEEALCPECAKKMNKLVSAPHVHFKGNFTPKFHDGSLPRGRPIGEDV